MFMRVNGKVQPCCKIGASYGDLCVQSFEEVWSGPKYKALRKALLTDEPPAVCAECSLYGWEPMDLGHPYATTNSAMDAALCVNEKDVRIATLEATLNRIYSSHGWKALQSYYKIRNKMFPVGGKREKVAKFVWGIFVSMILGRGHDLFQGGRSDRVG
jgi:hypothetical protein